MAVGGRQRKSLTQQHSTRERLACVGEKVLALAVTSALFNQRPILNVSTLETQIGDTLSDSKTDDWVTAYKMRDKMRCSPDARDSLTEPKVETLLLFHSHLVDDNFEDVAPGPPTQPGQQSRNIILLNNMKRMKIEPSPSQKLNHIEPPFSTPPPPPPQAPPPIPMAPPMSNGPYLQAAPTYFQPNPITPAQPTAAFLPAFNQLAAQRKHSVEWQAQSTGPSHAPAWTVNCLGE
ncbi:uncharacterized protein STEHIDRAFT_160214 [Stereum hirsutum FP-91666 SS1]|uniref:uncharacterized protein n=1 Tax=Stereum hirsutum (strain FP-91666) TaxID=721885 RepID=UPI0004449BC3|nr:uncharacterized protein STEHIDRAFT_160214 [Stereum hirsutum FP-91666 SS1]EIM83639.1 hypothetical protein STEHIDRAFT_160214 [Stereum hirsutum FP-91666 SS1]